ncbi:MAG: VapE domain-containing protein, partial [Lentilitoribacter sp.]
TAVATLFGPEYTAESVSLFDQHNKMVMAMKGHWVVELAEFVAFFKKDKSAVKGMISMRSDNVVLPYAKMASNHPRQCIFIGTINPGNFGYLTDDENRRYWPVTVGKCDTDLLLEHRDQIWAEAVAAYRNNEQWWLTEEEEVLAKEQVAARATVHPWDALVEEELAHVDHITVVEALKRIGVMKERMDMKEQFQIGESLRKNGFIKEDKRRMIDGVRAYWWVRKDG